MSPSLNDIFARTADAVFATDAALRVVYRNEAFDRICPQARGHAIGRHCYEVLCGRTLDGKRFCYHDCPVAQVVLQRQTVNDFDLLLPQPNGESLLVNVGACAVGHGYRPVAALFILRPINVRRFAGRIASDVSGHRREALKTEPLTQRERAVLQLLSEGYGTLALAKALQLSPTTVRNHIRNILRKLAVHSRTEAVSYAYRKHLV